MKASFNFAQGKEFATVPEAVDAIAECIKTGQTQLGRPATVERISIMKWADKYALSIYVSAEINDAEEAAHAK